MAAPNGGVQPPNEDLNQWVGVNMVPPNPAALHQPDSARTPSPRSFLSYHYPKTGAFKKMHDRYANVRIRLNQPMNQPLPFPGVAGAGDNPGMNQPGVNQGANEPLPVENQVNQEENPGMNQPVPDEVGENNVMAESPATEKGINHSPETATQHTNDTGVVKWNDDWALFTPPRRTTGGLVSPTIHDAKKALENAKTHQYQTQGLNASSGAQPRQSPPSKDSSDSVDYSSSTCQSSTSPMMKKAAEKLGTSGRKRGLDFTPESISSTRRVNWHAAVCAGANLKRPRNVGEMDEK